jgi:imidazolonepropionase-like amidohydrolase
VSVAGTQVPSRFDMAWSMRALCVFLSTLLCSLAWADSLVIQRVTVIDATGKPAQPGMTVVVEQDQIAAIGSWKKVKAPTGSQIVDGRGKFLIPGLWDMHVHAFATESGGKPGGKTWMYPLYLVNGIVGVRVMWGPEDANAWRAQHTRYEKASPTAYLASPIIDGPNPTWPGSVSVADAEQARAAVDRYKANGADFIKVYDSLSRDSYFAIADEAHKLGISFVGHVPDAIRVEEASDAGQKSIEHLTGVALGASSEEETLFAVKYVQAGDFLRRDLRAEATYHESKAAALFAGFVKNGTWQCPTLVVNRSSEHLDDGNFMHKEWLKYVPSDTRDFWKDFSENTVKARNAGIWADAHREFPEELKLVGRMYRAGVGILAGSDVYNPYVFPGFSLHDELSLLVEAGLPAMAALQAATIGPARFMGQADRRGTVEVGKVADLVLLDRDPLADIHNSTSIRAVIVGGKLMSRASLDAMLAEAEVLAAQPAPNPPGPATN